MVIARFVLLCFIIQEKIINAALDMKSADNDKGLLLFVANPEE